MKYIFNFFLIINNIITKSINYFFPYKSILYLSSKEQNIPTNITISFYIKWYLSLFLFYNYWKKNFNTINLEKKYPNKELYRIYIRDYNKYIFYDGIHSDIYNLPLIKNLFKNNNEEINKPRNLLIKYNIIVNGNELSIDEKIYFKKYDINSKIIDIFKFKGIKINEFKILKNNIEFKSYIKDIELISLKEIYSFL